MAHMLVRHKVAEYAKWKPIFDEHGASRKASGSKGSQLFRNADDPNELVILIEWEDLGKAKEWAGSDDLQQAMEKASVVGRPDIYFLDEVERQPQ